MGLVTWLFHVWVTRSAAEMKKDGDIYVVKQEEYIAPRFLIISPTPECIQIPYN